MWSMTDGHFHPTSSYFGAGIPQSPAATLFAPGGELHDLPLGSFLLRIAGDRVVLVDAGLGPDPSRGNAGSEAYLRFTCGDLPGQFAATGVATEEVTDIVLTHLHLDHYGWLLDAEGAEMFGRAQVWVGEDDLRYFGAVADGGLNDPMRALFGRLDREGRLHRVTTDAQICDEVGLQHAPGHTPGHLVVKVTSDGQTLWLLGDAMNCPRQLTETAWHSVGDVDPHLAHATRASLWAQLELPDTWGVGSHFPALTPGRVVAGHSRRWAGATGANLGARRNP